MNADTLYDANDAPINDQVLLDTLNLVLNKTTNGEFEILKELNA